MSDTLVICKQICNNYIFDDLIAALVCCTCFGTNKQPFLILFPLDITDAFHLVSSCCTNIATVSPLYR